MNFVQPSKETWRTESRHNSKWRGPRFWVACFTVLLGLPLLLYYSYCWGVWGRQSLLLQYLFQCNCPLASEEARYPDTVEVIVSACKYRGSILSPSGRLLYVQEEESGFSSTYLLNLQTNEKIPFTLPEGSNYFLTDELMFHAFYGDDEYIWNITTGKQYPIERFAKWNSDAYVNGELNLSILAERLREAKDVFLIDDDNIIALASDFYLNPERNFNIHRSEFPGRDANRVEQFLQQNNIAYHYVPDMFPGEAASPDGKFIARADGIYLVETNQKISDGYSASGYYRAYSGKYFSVRGWTYDSTSVIYSKFLKPCLLEMGVFVTDEVGCFVAVPQPLIKLKVPKEYLLPSKAP